MFVIEKCVKTNINARFISSESYLWIKAWSGERAWIRSGSVHDAITTFISRTSRVRSAPYRVRMLSPGTTLASVNANDDSSFKKYTIFAIGLSKTNELTTKIQECVGAVVPHTIGTVVGASNCTLKDVESRVNHAACVLASAIDSHRVITRYNSNGASGGAWLVTSPTTGILSNSDIGITYCHATTKISLRVDRKFMKNASSGNVQCPWTLKFNHESTHEDVEQAIVTLKNIANIATADELALLVA